MGLFTEVQHPTTGAWLQFKTGYDGWTHYQYQVGDTVHWQIIPDCAGHAHLEDDAYYAEAYSSDGYEIRGRYFVIIKDHKVLCVEDAILNTPEQIEADPNLPTIRDGEAAQAAYWRRQHGIQPLPIESWSDEAWAKRAKAEEAHRRDSLERDAEHFGVPAAERAVFAVDDFTRSSRQQAGLFRRILPPEPILEDETGDPT